MGKIYKLLLDSLSVLLLPLVVFAGATTHSEHYHQITASNQDDVARHQSGKEPETVVCGSNNSDNISSTSAAGIFQRAAINSPAAGHSGASKLRDLSTSSILDNTVFQSVKSESNPPSSVGSVVGHIDKSPNPQQTSFVAKDLVYIKLKPSAGNLIHVGDRFSVDIKNMSGIGDVQANALPIACSGQAGVIELICVGEHSALGIILKAQMPISRGLVVSRLCNHPEIR